MKRVLVGLGLVAALFTMSAYQDQAKVASYNLSKAADNFEITRRIVFVNGITDNYILSIEGRCSFEVESSAKPKLAVTCKVGPNEFKKHSLGLSDNVTFFSEQLESADVSVYRYRVTFRPSTILPDVRADLGL